MQDIDEKIFDDNFSKIQNLVYLGSKIFYNVLFKNEVFPVFFDFLKVLIFNFIHIFLDNKYQINVIIIDL